MELDNKDRQILEALQTNARQSLASLGKCIGLSQPAMSERVKKLESAGIIEGYGARVNLREIGLGLQAILRVRTTHQYIKHYLALFNDIPEVIEADRITGEDCFIVRCVFSKPNDLEAIVDALAVHGSVTTSLVLSNAVRKQVPVLPR
ncbi:transcriptional regulator, AsnC family [Serratia sp. AS12]|uniref:Lrp/AsnC family transcriptional regulator n=1 Tax=Serratia TaxID=613 RepID=UPI00020E9F9F|nr:MULTISPECIES: Lrp/AsnC family transcriptional regulator [Serratia]AEF46895.1 transcriptional regulator, AsnC family [Serratia plymuthica AS9]AEF51847.1 transcriptional regulator, AsnC family [Serratia sp. AS12]AEG29554.1 transcriptional regulator, AsnC family [Serratia sp. AS13]UTN95589.1 Lrp/AsnC family transcriptional regulator [Serratia plymuthica]